MDSLGAQSGSEIYLGLMSGTSLDGVDGVLADFGAGSPRVIGHRHREFAPDLRREFEMLNAPGWDDLHRAAVAAQHLAHLYADVVRDLLLHAGVEPGEVRAIGAHGQTVRHRPDAGYTLQLNAPAQLAELAGIDVVCDFRSRDVAAGGQGAPLVPAFHAAYFTAGVPRAVINIGGIANVTALPPRPGSDDTAAPVGPVTGFDCGPGNALVDAWVRHHRHEAFDRDGAWAASGSCDPELLARLLEDPYFEQPPPKSTGRERFNLEWVVQRLGSRQLAPADVQATLTRLTAATIAAQLRRHVPQAVEWIVCGGGARNGALMRMLEEEARSCGVMDVRASDADGIAAEQVEALAFAWLARAHMAGETASLPSVTGARGPRVLGARYPAGTGERRTPGG